MVPVAEQVPQLLRDNQVGRKEQVLSDKHAGRIEHVLKVLKDKQV